MLETSQTCRCVDSEDKKLILRILNETISRENEELRKIAAKRTRDMLKPPFVESFTGIRSSLIRVREEFRRDIEDFKKKIEEYPDCKKILKQPVIEIGFNIHKPQSDIPVQYSERKLF